MYFLKEIGDFKSSFTILSMPHESVDDPQAQDFQISEGKIDFDQLSFVYNEGKSVFANLNLRIKPGEKIGLVGHSGAGNLL